MPLDISERKRYMDSTYVYAIVKYLDGDGILVIGLYSTKEAARKSINTLEKFLEYDIERWEVHN